MTKNLVIVESPAKAKTIEKYLGKDYTVKSSFGHVRDLEKSKLSIDVENDFAPTYVISEDKQKIVSELTKLAKSAEIIWLATDEDREGEAISWHVYEILKNINRKIIVNIFGLVMSPFQDIGNQVKQELVLVISLKCFIGKTAGGTCNQDY